VCFLKIGILSIYPPTLGGVSDYTKQLFTEIFKINSNVFVLADKQSSNPVEKNVLRVWNNNIFFPFQIIAAVLKQKINLVHIQFEVSLYSGALGLILIPFLITCLRILGVRVVVTLHQVVSLNEINSEFLLENNYPKNVFITKSILRLAYGWIGFFSNFIIVHEQKFKTNLLAYGFNSNKISVIKIGVLELNSSINSISKAQAQKALGIFDKQNKNKLTFLFFGFVAGYKGLDLIIEALQKIQNNNFNFIVVGSKHPRLKNNFFYNEFYNKIKNAFEKDACCKFIEYVKDSEIKYLFKASDCLVLPYKNNFSSSAPLALGLAHKNLIIASNVFEGVLPKELLFKRNSDCLCAMMELALKGKLNAQKKKLDLLRKKCVLSKIAKETNELYGQLLVKEIA
jgi:glycosyltransferase involved in cell wall biosynthesis